MLVLGRDAKGYTLSLRVCGLLPTRNTILRNRCHHLWNRFGGPCPPPRVVVCWHGSGGCGGVMRVGVWSASLAASALTAPARPSRPRAGFCEGARDFLTGHPMGGVFRRPLHDLQEAVARMSDSEIRVSLSTLNAAFRFAPCGLRLLNQAVILAPLVPCEQFGGSHGY
jgi:hypothetical protein